mgnify:CR=1 FL=1
MKSKDVLFLLSLMLGFTCSIFAETRYVDINNATPAAPFSSWSTAANQIQDAIDMSSNGDIILVANGVYAAGGKSVTGILTNRIAIDKAVTVQSVDGPEVTIILGYQSQGPDDDSSPVRCAYLADGAVLNGFTCMNGSARNTSDPNEATGGAVWCASTNAFVFNCILRSNVVVNSLEGIGGGAYSGTLSNCVLEGNSAVGGGGAAHSVLIDCRLERNVASRFGGGAFNSILKNSWLSENSAANGGGTAQSYLESCVISQNSATEKGGGIITGTVLNSRITGNRAVETGGGIYFAFATNCIVATNSARMGGGADMTTLERCQIHGNIAYQSGGGVSESTVLAGALFENRAALSGGGATSSTLIHCTLAGNTASAGGGVNACNATNSIIYFNSARTDANFAAGILDHCCTFPVPTNGTGNIIADPQLVDFTHINPASPCVAQGSPSTGTDIDGQSWNAVPSIGCDEPLEAISSESLSIFLTSSCPGAATNVSILFTARVSGHATSNIWDFGDGQFATNLVFANHAFSHAGTFIVSVRAFNDSNPDGVLSSTAVTIADDPVQYVAIGNPSPTPPYLTWETAATNIQDAIDHGFAGGTILVSSGVYQTGGRALFSDLTNRVVVDRPVTLRSVNGPVATTIVGFSAVPSGTSSNAIRGIYLCDGATLDGFTIMNGATLSFPARTTTELDSSGGGVWCESTNAFVINCTIVANTAATWGGGVYSGTISNSVLLGNRSTAGSIFGGGGAAWSRVFNTMILSNVAGTISGGGAITSLLSNCRIIGNIGGTVDCTIFDSEISANESYGMYRGSAFNTLISSNRSASDGVGGGATLASLSNCVIYANWARHGGGIFNSTLNYCTVSNNFATNYGGGIFRGNTLTPSGSGNVIAGNSSGLSGGGFYATSSTTVALTNWIFINNSTDGQGGALHMNSGTLSLYNCRFDGNSAGGNGGGIFSQAFNATCITSSFSNNIAGGFGGGTHSVNVNDCVLVGNRAVSGGGVYNGSVSNSLFYRNSALLDGGGYWGAGGLRNCSFLENTAGGNGGGAHSGNAAIADCTFDGNSSVTNGGGLFVTVTAQIRNSSFLNNRSTFGGGSYNGTFNETLFLGNVATNSGGGIFNPSFSSTTSSNCVFADNLALTNGGGVAGGSWIWSQFTGNRAGLNGGGGYNCSIANSTITENSALTGGGVYFGALSQCLLYRNRAQTGGAIYNSANYPVRSSTVVDNTATNVAGGVFSSSGTMLVNSIVFFNSAPTNSNHSGTFAATFNCLTPILSGTGNTNADPRLIDIAGGNFRLQTNSPCINAGGGDSPGTFDRDRRPRLVGRIDIGAFEFQGPGTGEFIHWLVQHGLPSNGSADLSDPDADGMNNQQEWIAGTNPTDSFSLLKLLVPIPNPLGTELKWSSVAGKSYSIERSEELSSSFSVIASNVPGLPETTSYVDSTATNISSQFYRVRVE